MFVCLSSGATVRYRDDVLRAIAMPTGSRLQFRYDMQRWVAPTIRTRLERGEAVSGPTLIAYIDQPDVTKIPELVPCRFATLLEALPHGTTVTLTLELREFAYAENVNAFNTELRGLSVNTLPVWQADGKIRGSYWLDVAQNPTTVIKSAKLAEMEKIVNQLAQHAEFAEETRFYTVLGIYSVSGNDEIHQEEGIYKLGANKEYEIRLYHFSPKKTPAGKILVSESTELLSFTTSSTLVLDSRYDLKRVRMKTAKPIARQTSVLTLLYQEGEQSTLEFDLGIVVGGAGRH